MYFSKNLTGGRSLAKRYASFVVLMLMLLFAGCADEPEPENKNTGFIPLGRWTDSYGGSYDITNVIIEFNSGNESGYEEYFLGRIGQAVNFSSGTGVLIVQILMSVPTGQTGKFIGVYYKGYTATHIFLANAIDESYNLIVKDTLAEAKTTFTVDNVDTHVTHWGSGYKK